MLLNSLYDLQEIKPLKESIHDDKEKMETIQDDAVQQRKILELEEVLSELSGLGEKNAELAELNNKYLILQKCMGQQQSNTEHPASQKEDLSSSVLSQEAHKNWYIIYKLICRNKEENYKKLQKLKTKMVRPSIFKKRKSISFQMLLFFFFLTENHPWQWNSQHEG